MSWDWNSLKGNKNKQVQVNKKDNIFQYQECTITSKYDEEKEPMTFASKAKIATGITITIGLVALLACSSMIIENVKAGQYVVKQSAISGDLEVWDQPGWKLQNFADLTFYDRSNQLWFSATKDGVKLPPDQNKSMPIRFSDGGRGWISGSIRYSLPSGDKLLNLHRTYRSATAIHTDLIIPMIQKSINLAGPSMTSKESAAAKRNELLAIIEDQITNGAYRTITEKKVIEDLDGTKKTVDIMVPLKDPHAPNGIARVEESPASKYGIVFSSFAINEIIYEDRVDQAIQKQYELEMEVQTAMAAARTAEQDRKTAEAKGEADKTRAEWAEKTEAARQIVQAERDREMAIITANRELEVAKLQKEQADQIKQAAILKAEGEAKAQELMAQARKKLMEADNALQAKLDAYVEVNRAYADAISKIHLPNVVMTSDGKNSGSNAAMDILDLIKVKTAKDLALDTTVR